MVRQRNRLDRGLLNTTGPAAVTRSSEVQFGTIPFAF